MGLSAVYRTRLGCTSSSTNPFASSRRQYLGETSSRWAMSSRWSAIRSGTRITVVFPVVHFRGYVVDERAIIQGMIQIAPRVNPVTGNDFPVTQPLTPTIV